MGDDGAPLPAEGADVEALRRAGYEVEEPDTAFSTAYAVEHVVVAPSPADVPHVVGCAGPARSGTTGLLFTLASQPEVDRAWFQPLKTLLRLGAPDLVLDRPGLVCLKEVFRGCCPANDHDPIAILLRAGVPADHITWVTILRDPVRTYASWTRHIAGSAPEDLAAAQRYALDLHDRYTDLGLTIVPLAYDLLAGREAEVLAAVLRRAPIALGEATLGFDRDAIDRKMAYGQASDPAYFAMSVRPTLERGRLTHDSDDNVLPAGVAGRVRALCQDDYDLFRERSRHELGLVEG